MHSWKSSVLRALNKPKSSTRCETPGPNIPRSSPLNLSRTADPVGRAYASNRCSPEIANALGMTVAIASIRVLTLLSGIAVIVIMKDSRHTQPA